MAAVPSAKTRIEKQTSLTSGAGTIASTGTAVTGSSTTFDPDVPVGSVIIAGGEARAVTARASDTALTVDAAFTTDLPALSTFTVVVFGLITGATDLTGPETTATDIDVSEFSTAGYRSKIPGLKDAGSLSFTLWFQPKSAVHAALQADMSSQLQKAWRVWIPDSATAAAPPGLSNSFYYLMGAMSQFSVAAALDSAWKAQAKVLINGEPRLIVGVD